MLRKWLCQAEVNLDIYPVDPLLIKSGYATLDAADMVPVSTVRNGKRTYFLPGTSLKGVLRSHFERICRSLLPRSVCIPYYDPGRISPKDIPVDEERQSFGCGFRQPESGPNNSATAYRDSCAACRLFGSLRFTGRLSIGDAFASAEKPPIPELRNGVGIDRFTGGTVPGVLFDLQVLVGGKYETSIRLVNFELWQLAALNFLLRDLQDELITLGSGRSRGLGRVRGEVTRYQLLYLRLQQSVRGLGQRATPEEQEAYRLHPWTPEPPIPLPEGRFSGLRHTYDVSQNWAELLRPLVPACEDFLVWHGGPKGICSRS